MEKACVGQLNVFGGVACAARDGATIPLKGRRTRELLASLALTGSRPELRDRISGRLWPDCTARNARKALNTALWRLRSTLKDAGTDPDRWIKQDSETLALVKEGGPKVDLSDFRQLAGASNLPVSFDSSAILDLYKGKFAAGLDADWIEVERRGLHRKFTDLLRRVAETWSEAHRLRDAMALAETLVLDDPLDEDARRLLLRLQIDSGNRGKALREYSDLKSVLQEELGVAPSASTQATFFGEERTEHYRAYRIEADEGMSGLNEVEAPGFRIEETKPADDLPKKVAELKVTAEKLLSGLAALEQML